MATWPTSLLRPGPDLIALLVGFVLASVGWSAWLWSAHEALILTGGAVVLGVLGGVYERMRRVGRDRAQARVEQLRSVWEEEHSDKLNVVRAFLVKSLWDQGRRHVAVTLTFFAQSPLPRVVTSGAIDPQTGAPLPVRVRLTSSGGFAGQLYLVEENARTGLLINGAQHAPQFTFTAEGDLPALLVNPPSCVTTVRVEVLCTDDHGITCDGIMPLF